MAVATSNLTHGNDTDGNSTATTASFTVPANQLCLALVATRTASGDPNHATITGWTEVLSVNFDNSGSQKRLTLLRFLGSGSTGTQTIDFASQNQTDVVWVIDTFTGANTTGTNGSGAIGDKQSNQDTSGTGTTLSVTLTPVSPTTSATYGACAVGNTAVVFTPGSGFTTTGSDQAAANGVFGASEFRNDSVTTVDFSVLVPGELGIIGVEIKAAVAASIDTLLMMGV